MPPLSRTHEVASAFLSFFVVVFVFLKDSVLLVSLVLFFSLKEKKQTLTVTNRV